MNNDTEVLEEITQLIDELCERVTNSDSDDEITLGDVKLYIESVCWTGTWIFYVSYDTKIGQIKSMALSELDMDKYEARSNLYSLMFPTGKRILNESKTIQEENLENEAELELIRMPPSQEVLIRFAQRISETAITNATSALPPPQAKPIFCNIILDIQPPEFMSDVRKIMVTLIEYSLLQMSTRSNARNIFDVVRRKLMSENLYVNDTVLNQYAETGASVKRIRFAVNASYNDSFSVKEWLEEVKEIDSDHLGLPPSFHVDDNITIQNELDDLLVLFHQYLRASFKVCGKALNILLEMGFDFDEIQKALRYTGNNTSEAVIYLLGYTDPKADGAKPGLDQGMSRTSDMYKTIMSEPAIVLPLSDPSVLYASLSVMDANSFLVSSMRFPTLMNLLNKILATYYITRCNLAMNQVLGNIPND